MLSKLVLILILLKCIFCAEKAAYHNVVMVYKGERGSIKTTISGNSLSKGLPKVVYEVTLFNQNIRNLYPNAITNLEEVTSITIKRCELNKVYAGAFKNVTFKKGSLLITYNKLKIIKTNVFNDLNVEMLDLSRNQIDMMENGAFNGMKDLRKLNLAYNKLSTWDGNWILQTPSLYSVEANNNNIKEIPDNAFGERNLFFLNMYSNRIEKIGPNALLGVKRWMSLRLARNSLRTFDVGLLQKGSLVLQLDLQYNSITCLEGDLNSVKWGSTILLTNNKLTCSCREKIIAWQKSSGKHVTLGAESCQEG